jgi:hypothetical protein
VYFDDDYCTALASLQEPPSAVLGATQAVQTLAVVTLGLCAISIIVQQLLAGLDVSL